MTATRVHPERGASPRIARTINDRLALHLLQQEGPLTAGRLKELTGMSRPSVADLLERLKAAGLIEVVGESGAARRGPNARVYGIVASRAYVAGLDVRVESVAVEIADLLGRTVARADLPVAAGADPARLVEDGVELLRGTARAAGVAALHTVAFGAPGLVDPATGRRGASVGLPAWHPDFADALRERLGVPVLVENEVNLAAVAELRAGGPAAQDDSFVLLWLGGGVGAAVVLDGRLRRGVSGGAGEVGFLPLSASGDLPTATDCDNGFHGMVGSRAVLALARAHVRAAGATRGFGTSGGFADREAAVHDTAVRDAAVGPAGRAPGEPAWRDDAQAAAAAVRAALAAGPDGAAFLDELAGRIALGAAAVCAVLDPGRVVLAGEVGQAGGEALAARVAGHLALLSPLRTEVRPSALTEAPILRGAVLTAMDAAQSALFTTPAL